MPDDRFFIGSLENGLRVVVERMRGVRAVAAGFLCRTGARDEQRDLAGVSHFLEHMCFKGTPRRSAAQINIDFDRIGGQPNAFTSHERTFYHAVARADDFQRQVEILADMMESTLPADEFDMEKKVVLEEIAMSNDRIDHVAFDLLIEKVFAGHALGWPVLGYEDTVGALTRDQMLAYFQERYRPNNMTLVVAGAVEPDAVMAAARAACGHWSPGDVANGRSTPQIQTGEARRSVERFQQQVVAVTFPAPSSADPLHETAEAAAAILGGNNSRFYWQIEQQGLCPHAGAYRLDFGDCGLLILLAHCTPDKTEAVIDALRAEARRMMTGADCGRRVRSGQEQAPDADRGRGRVARVPPDAAHG